MSDTAAFDADGHIGEDMSAIRKLMPDGFVGPEESLSPFDRYIFPSPMIHHAAQPIRLPATFGTGRLDQWVAFMNYMPLQGAALYPTLGLTSGYFVNPTWAIAACACYNTWLYETYLVHDERFVGMGLLPAIDPAAAAEELHRCVSGLGMAGGILPSTGLAEPLGAPQFDPIFRQANDLGCCLAVHGGMHLGLGLNHLPVYATVNALGHPMGQLVQFASVMSSGLLDRYGNFRIAFLEAGAAWVELALERFDRAWETHIQLDPDKRFWQMSEDQKVSDYLGNHARAGRWFFGLEGDERSVAVVTEILGTNPAMFSSDFPHEVTMERCKEELNEIALRPDLGEEAREKMRWHNAATLYGRI